MVSLDELKGICKEYNKPSLGIPRKKYLKEIIPFLKRREILILKGIRRSGKSTILKQMINHLKGEGIPEKNIAYVAVDDYRLLGYRNFELLNLILQLVDRKERSYIFLDEVQVIPGFENWLKTQYDIEANVKLVISGSGSQLLSKELGTLLTGRNISFEIFPLDYKEFLDFGKESNDEFITYGGFPEVVLAEKKEEKIRILQNYISNIIEKDVIMKKAVKEPAQMENLIHLVMSNPGIRISLNRLSKQIGINIVTLKKYLGYLKEAYLIFEVPYFSYSAKSKFIASNIPKYYVLDNGFYAVNAARKERGKQVEAAAAQKLFRDNKEVFYWKGKNEVDFVAQNIAYNIVSSDDVPERELKGLNEISHDLRYIKNKILVSNNEDKEEKGIKFVPLWKWLID